VRRLIVYPDTSVFGGCFDREFAEESRTFFAEIRSGRFDILVSETTLRELQRAPDYVRQVLADVPEDRLMSMALSEEVEALRDAYVDALVVGASAILDAEHIASASVAGVDLIVSWNFKHVVHFEKIRGYHAVNLLRGYHPIPIHTPREVVLP
jgi:predicted nucleic acid-binding protein